MRNLEQLTSNELRERAKTLNDTLVRIRKYASQEEIEELETDLELIQKEREERHAK